jgi:Zn-dependent protease with chaperone function
VVTTALLAAVTPEELRAVLAHEDGHLRQRHHVALLLCRTLFGTLAPVFPVFRRAMPHVLLLVELSADDHARRRVGSRPLRHALATLACSPAPPGALAASSLDVETRLRRLEDGHSSPSPIRSGFASLAVVSIVLVPLALVAAPAVALAWEGICLIA